MEGAFVRGAHVLGGLLSGRAGVRVGKCPDTGCCIHCRSHCAYSMRCFSCWSSCLFLASSSEMHVIRLIYILDTMLYRPCIPYTVACVVAAGKVCMLWFVM